MARAILPPEPSSTSSSWVSARLSRISGAASAKPATARWRAAAPEAFRPSARAGERPAEGGRGAGAGAAHGVERGLAVAAHEGVGGGGDGGQIGIGQERVEPGLDLLPAAAGEGRERHAIGGAERVGAGRLGGRSRGRGVAELDGAGGQGAEGHGPVRALCHGAERLDRAGARILAHRPEHAREPLRAARERRQPAERLEPRDHPRVVGGGGRGAHAEQRLVRGAGRASRPGSARACRARSRA